MIHYKKHKRNPLFDGKQGETLISFLDDEQHKKIAQLIFVEGMTTLEVAEKMDYSVRQIERIRADIMKVALLNLIEKQIPKKPNIHGYREGREINTISYTCPICNKHIGRENYCKHCGQALDWSDSE